MILRLQIKPYMLLVSKCLIGAAATITAQEVMLRFMRSQTSLERLLEWDGREGAGPSGIVQFSTFKAYAFAALHQIRSAPQSAPISRALSRVMAMTLFTNHSKNMLLKSGTCCSIRPTEDASTILL